MRILADLTEDDVIEIFLRAELDSERFGPALRTLLEGEALPDDPSARRELLRAHRGWPDQGLMADFPNDVDWFWARLTRDELLAVQYIDWDYWRELAPGTRLPIHAQLSPEQRVEFAAMRLDAFPPLIVVGDGTGKLVVLEGHVRLTALALDPPEQLEVALGLSKRMSEWCQWGND